MKKRIKVSELRKMMKEGIDSNISRFPKFFRNYAEVETILDITINTNQSSYDYEKTVNTTPCVDFFEETISTFKNEHADETIESILVTGNTTDGSLITIKIDEYDIEETYV